jgi:hypothetical protein
MRVRTNRAAMMLIAAISRAPDFSAHSAKVVEAGIIERLTMDLRDQAIACGRAGIDCAVTPYRVCPSNDRYSAKIVTPFSRIASSVFEALEAGRRPNPMTPGAATRWGVGVLVYPAPRSAKADAIQRLEIRRDGRVIRPITSTVGPIAAEATDGSTSQLSRGFFGVAADVFAPSSDVTLVFIGASGETTCTLDRDRLSALR